MKHTLIIAGIVYLLLINAAGFCMMGIDKYRARKGLWRIKESALIMSAILGGGAGAYIGMQAFRHKTKHKKFTTGIPAICLLELAAGFAVYFLL